MHAGKLMALGTVSELKEIFSDRAVLEVKYPDIIEGLSLMSEQDWVLETSVFGTRMHLVVRDAEEGKRRALQVLKEHGNGAAEVREIVPSLEDVFIHHIEKKEASE
jgi:ABC-type multidrug transport system ATPase subunit